MGAGGNRTLAMKVGAKIILHIFNFPSLQSVVEDMVKFLGIFLLELPLVKSYFIFVERGKSKNFLIYHSPKAGVFLSNVIEN